MLSFVVTQLARDQGGTFTIAAEDVPALTAEIAKFSANVVDPKASMAAYYLGAAGSVSLPAAMPEKSSL